MAIRRGVAGAVYFRVEVTATGAGATGDTAQLSATLSKDGAALAAAAGTIVEVDSGDQPGIYKLPLSATETDADLLVIVPATSTGANRCTPRAIFEYTDPDWENDVLGATYDASTDSLAKLREAMEDSLAAIERDD